MARNFTDDDIIEVMPYARGDDREVLIIELGKPGNGATNSRVIAELSRLYSSERGHARTAALQALIGRAGETGIPYAVGALRSRYWGLQAIGSQLLADFGGSDVAGPLFTWFELRLSAKDRPGNWDPYHLLTAARFAVRHGLYVDLARLLVKHWGQLSDEEIEWLHRYWPGLFDQDGAPHIDESASPPANVGTYIFDELYPPQSPEERTAALLDCEKAGEEYLTAAYRRARRRRDRQDAS